MELRGMGVVAGRWAWPGSRTRQPPAALAGHRVRGAARARATLMFNGGYFSWSLSVGLRDGRSGVSLARGRAGRVVFGFVRSTQTYRRAGNCNLACHRARPQRSSFWPRNFPRLTSRGALEDWSWNREIGSDLPTTAGLAAATGHVVSSGSLGPGRRRRGDSQDRIWGEWPAGSQPSGCSAGTARRKTPAKEGPPKLRLLPGTEGAQNLWWCRRSQ